jgi:hypothetical protein
VPDFDVHFEEFLHLAGLGHDKALIAWGGFYFRRGDSPYGEWRIVDDEELAAVAPTPRSETIGAGSEPFGRAIVEVERDGRVVARAETEEQLAGDEGRMARGHAQRGPAWRPRRRRARIASAGRR